MAKEQEFNGDQAFNNTVSQLDADFAQTIRDLHDSLSSKGGSPVYSGFLASSWKVRREPIKDRESVYEVPPWAGIRRQLDAVWASDKEERRRKRRELSNQIAVVDPRFPVNTAYKFINADIYIGNAAEYAGYSAEDQRLSNFIQQEAGEIIKDNMRDKGKIFLGVKPGSGFGSVKPGSSLRYIEG
nr:putative phage tail protein [uncultured Mediterranean phage uvMED]BAR21743.1 putative phage tail protein [uncultured Mediterranean phage uvMED]BAR21844.1 putative phage tail protein [uncultured Mediterranean phage uvMED]BAR38793.1 putative phage tail protein [uncultured Mediterranean phage uvMED]